MGSDTVEPVTSKTSQAFRTIGEVAKELGVAQHVLRFWEGKFDNWVQPVKRNGRRYYRPEDITLLKTIKHLLYQQGYTIKGVQRYLLQQGDKADLFTLPDTARPETMPVAPDASKEELASLLSLLESAKTQAEQNS